MYKETCKRAHTVLSYCIDKQLKVGNQLVLVKIAQINCHLLINRDCGIFCVL